MFNQALSKFENKNILIVGMAREGLSTVEFLLKHVSSAQLRVTDQKITSEINKKWSGLLGKNNNLKKIEIRDIKNINFDFVFRTPGIHLDVLQKTYQFGLKTKVTSNTKLFFDLINSFSHALGKPLTIGVTGTKGKSTTTSQIFHILQTGAGEIKWHGLNQPQILLGGNIGVPLLRLLENNLHPEKSIFVSELSSHQLSDLKTSPQIAVVQDITPDHLDYYLNFGQYLEAKTAICKYQTKTDLVIYNSDSQMATEIAKFSPGEKIPFSLGDESLINLIKSANSPLIGEHNLYNTLPGVIIAQHLGISDTTLKNALVTFKAVPHRLELVKIVRGIKFYNDSAANTPEAAIAALKSFAHQPVILIAGGSDKGIPFEKLAYFILESNIKFIILFPTTGEKILDSLREADAHHPLIENHQFASSMKEAVKIAVQHAQSGDIVLLSPACASFSLFKSYEDRGNQFRKLVKLQK